MSNFFTTKEINKIKSALQKADGIIAFPTDTVWGIGCLIENYQAVERIYSLKNRDKTKPLILMGSNSESLLSYTKKTNPIVEILINKYFPGNLTIILNKNSNTPDYITSNQNTVGIRVPNCPVLNELLEKCVKNKVLATTSANISGASSKSTKQEVIEEIGIDVDYVVDDYGYKPSGVASSVVLVENDVIKILREGQVKVEI